MTIGPVAATSSLRSLNGNVFLHESSGENASGAAWGTFTIRPDQRATAVTVENPDEEGLGTFQRKRECETTRSSPRERSTGRLRRGAKRPEYLRAQ